MLICKEVLKKLYILNIRGINFSSTLIIITNPDDVCIVS